jgi:uncharacterized protein (DUF1778 family)
MSQLLMSNYGSLEPQSDQACSVMAVVGETILDTVKSRIQQGATMSTTARFDLTIDAVDKDIIARAASLMGTTMAGFVRAAAKEKAQDLLDRESRITLSQRDFTAFASAINGAFTPNAALQGALTASSRVKRA